MSEADTLRLRASRLMQLGKPAEALENLERLLAARPDDALALNDHGIALQSLQRLPAAMVSYDGALRLQPDSATVLVNRSNTLHLLGRRDEALEDLQRAIRLRPGFPEALNSLGNVLSDLGRQTEALDSFDRALALRPDFTLAKVNRAKLLLEMHRLREALAGFKQALRDSPDDPEAHFGRASALLQLGERLEVALASFEFAAQLGLERPEALFGKAAALAGLQRDAEAAACIVELLKIAPDRDYALGGLIASLLQCASWSSLAALAQEVCTRVCEQRRAIHPYTLLMVSDEPQLHLAAARAAIADEYPANDALGHHPAAPRRPDAPIRVAYVSGDFREHPVSYLLVDTLERHDRKRFEVIGVSLRKPGQSAFERRVFGAFDQVLDVSAQPDRQVAAHLRELGVDIAVDLMGFTEGSRLDIFAHRAAPVQVSYLGYPGTTGAPYMDYLIGDEVVIPRQEERYYSERIVRLPHCYLPNDARRPIGAPLNREMAGLPAQAAVLCAFTAISKINPLIFTLWMRLLAAVPSSVLWLREPGSSARRRLRQQAEAQGVQAERLIFAPTMSMARHLARQSLADLYLDTVPYNAHSTACEALWAGLPVLTCRGRGMASRAAASALLAAGLPELITDSLQDYELRALQLLRSPDALAELKGRLVAGRANCALFDSASYTRHLETAFLQMQERVQRGLPPEHLSIAPGAVVSA